MTRWTGRPRRNTGLEAAAIALMLGLAVVLLAGLNAEPLEAHPPQSYGARLVEFKKPIPAPEFALRGTDGSPVQLRDYRGRFVLLNFWATWCPPCVREMPSLESLSRTMNTKRFVVLGVSLDAEGAAKVKPFLAHAGITFPIVLDPESRAAGLYGAYDIPATFLVDPRGRVIVAGKGARNWSDPDMVTYLREVMERPL